MKVKITVLKRDMNRRFRTLADKCPVARAINRKLHSGYRASVCVHVFDIIGKDLGVTATIGLPSKVCGFICRFDSLVVPKPEPISFVVSIPKRFLKV